MPSVQASLIRRMLNWRKVRIARDASVEQFRAEVKRSEWVYRRPRGVQIRPIQKDGFQAEWLVPQGAAARPIILYLHGGGWVMRLYNLNRHTITRFCRATGGRALAVDYRLAPEYPFPAGLENCLAAYRYLLQNGAAPRDIVIAGDSAGGNLVLASLLALRDAGDPLPAAAVCISPVTDLAGTGDSFQSTADAALAADFLLTTIRAYVGGGDVQDPLVSPLYGDLGRLPPLLIQVGADEVLLSDAVRFAEKASAAGVDTTLTVWPGMWHVWHVFAPYLPEARQAFSEIGAFVSKHTRIVPTVQDRGQVGSTSISSPEL